MKKFKKLIVGFVTAIVAASAYAQDAIDTTAMDGVIDTAKEWITWGVTAFTTIIVAGLGIFMARWAYNKIIKRGITSA